MTGQLFNECLVGAELRIGFPARVGAVVAHSIGLGKFLIVGGELLGLQMIRNDINALTIAIQRIFKVFLQYFLHVPRPVFGVGVVKLVRCAVQALLRVGWVASVCGGDSIFLDFHAP